MVDTRPASFTINLSASNVTLADTDRFIVNDAGQMKQTAVTGIWNYVKGKITGAISGLLTSNLSINAALVSDSNGKIVAGDGAARAHRPYRSAVFLISSSSTNNPTVNTLENTTGLTFTFTRVGVGQYDVTTSGSGAITISKTATYISTYSPTIEPAVDHYSHGKFRINVYWNGSWADGRLEFNTLEFRIYD
jgi:hypothetical protein